MTVNVFYFINQIQCFSPLPTLQNSVVAIITLYGYTCSQLVAAKHFFHTIFVQRMANKLSKTDYSDLLQKYQDNRDIKHLL